MCPVIFLCCSEIISLVDMKCTTVSRCWYCKDLCENCLLPSGFGPGLALNHSESGILLKFCDHKCAQHFTGLEEKPMTLDIEILPPRSLSDCAPRSFLKISGSGHRGQDTGARISCIICHGYHSEEHQNGRFYVLCQLRSLFNQKVIEMFVTDKAIPEEPLPHANCPSGHEKVASAKASGTITQVIICALKVLQQKLIHLEYEDVDLNLNILTKYRSCFFKGDKEATSSIKVSEFFGVASYVGSYSTNFVLSIVL